MSRELRERLERAQSKARSLSQELEQAPSGPLPLPAPTQEAVDHLRSETLRVVREVAPLEATLAAARARRAAAEQALLQLQGELSQSPQAMVNAITGGAMLGFAAVLRLATGLLGPQPPTWVNLGLACGAAAWLLRDAWRAGRVAAARFTPPP